VSIWRGPYTKIPKSVIYELWDDDKALATYVRQRISEDKARRRWRRAYVPPRIWASILERFGHACAYCGASGVPLQREHRMPIALGGPDIPSNLVPACGPCNRRKFTDHPDMWPVRGGL
jgi:5-methylcytosine-specific restriction endonuclease McrA